MLNVHPSRAHDLLEPDELQTEPRLEITYYLDGFGNRCARFVAPQGQLRLFNSTLIRDSGRPDETNWSAREIAVGDLPHEMLSFPAQQPLLRGGSFLDHCTGPFRTHRTRVGTRAGDLQLGPQQGGLQLSARRGLQRRLSMCLRSAWVCAATFNIWPSPSAAR